MLFAQITTSLTFLTWKLIEIKQINDEPKRESKHRKLNRLRATFSYILLDLRTNPKKREDIMKNLKSSKSISQIWTDFMNYLVKNRTFFFPKFCQLL